MEERGTKTLIIIFAIALLVIVIVVLILAVRSTRTGAGTGQSATGCTSPSAPTGISAIDFQITKIRVSWSYVAAADSYKIYVGTVPGFTKSNSFADYSTRSNEYFIDDLTMGRTYYIFVESIGNCGTVSKEVSKTVSATLTFPARFQIVNRQSPNLGLKIAPDFQNIIVDNLCSGTGLDNLCIWRYDADNGYIVSDSAINNCMKTYPAAVDLRVKYEACSTISYYNYAAARQWNYDPKTGSLCNPLNPEGLNCVKINNAAVPGQSTIRTPYDGTGFMQWDIVEVI